RLIMLSKNKHNRLTRWYYLLILPLVGGMVLMSGWTASAQNQDAGKKAQVKKEVALKLQELGFVKTGENTWTKEGITMKLSEGQSTAVSELVKDKAPAAKDQKAKTPQKGQIKFTAPVIVPDTAGHSGKEVKPFSYAVVDVKPEFPGGDEALLKFIRDNTKYPTEAVEKKIEGRVFVGFVISKTGEIEQAKVLRGVEPGLDAEALRVINSMPKWTPGAVAGKPVAVSYQVPMSFTLSKDGTKK
ncbi:MAG: energy transducer TonB, partial [Bacteroidales bacterium]|nr:energy transducer TonB [Bacteroidales bacterium]